MKKKLKADFQIYKKMAAGANPANHVVITCFPKNTNHSTDCGVADIDGSYANDHNVRLAL